MRCPVSYVMAIEFTHAVARLHAERLHECVLVRERTNARSMPGACGRSTRTSIWILGVSAEVRDIVADVDRGELLSATRHDVAHRVILSMSHGRLKARLGRFIYRQRIVASRLGSFPLPIGECTALQERARTVWPPDQAGDAAVPRGARTCERDECPRVISPPRIS